MLDLKHIDPMRGPRAVFAAEYDPPDDGSAANFDNGGFPSPAVAADGTFYWQSYREYSMATGRHLELTARRDPALGSGSHGQLDLSIQTKDVAHATVKWQHHLRVGGRMVVDDDGTVYWASGHATNPDGTVKWQAQPPGGWAYASGGTTEVERPGKRSYWPMAWDERTSNGASIPGKHRLAAHSLVDGSVLWFQDMPLLSTAQNQYSGSFSAQGPDGTLYLATRPNNWATPSSAHGFIQARDGGTGDLMWQAELPAAEGLPESAPSEVVGGLVPAPNGDGVYAASQNCKLYHLDRNGQVVSWFRMAGQPVWDIPQLVDGVLYVVAEAPRNLDGGDGRWCALWQPDAVERYDCFFPQCGPCANGGSLVYLYAFQVE